ncbi:hypothetical protein MD484_g2833, partial [Candolleomyces efflorescens]
MSSPELAKPPGPCCFEGVKHSGTPIGREDSIGGIPTYISEPAGGFKPGGKIILYFADIYGPLFINSKLIQDYFASQGFDREGWKMKNLENAKKIVPGWVEQVRNTYGEDAKYSAVGYCFGAPFTLNYAATEWLSAAAIAHPAYLNEDHFQNLKKPLLLSLAETDHTFPTESRRRAVDILSENKSTYHVQLFSGVSHGFAVRADTKVENSRWVKEESSRGIVAWFDRFSK